VSELLNNILTEPRELRRSLTHAVGAGRGELEKAANLVNRAQHVYITGIGSSWHAGMAVSSIFEAHGRPVHLVDASELLHYVKLPEKAVVIMLSRSGKSVEIVNLLDKAATAKARVIGITNTPESPLAKRADATLKLEAAFDRNISITMYSALTLVGGLLALCALRKLDAAVPAQIEQALVAAEAALQTWQDQVKGRDWFHPELPTYFLARGGSMASASETRLLWEEGAKAPACAMTTGGFRHGPQEIISSRIRIAIWIDVEKMRAQDLALAADLRKHGANVMLIGQDLPKDAADVVLQVPQVPPAWQFLIDIIPGQIAAEYLARIRKADCDNFIFCPYVIQTEGGL
jgi:glutamine---fructose-6-phosphate transaminase (isomerizing)